MAMAEPSYRELSRSEDKPFTAGDWGLLAAWVLIPTVIIWLVLGSLLLGVMALLGMAFGFDALAAWFPIGFAISGVISLVGWVIVACWFLARLDEQGESTDDPGD